MRDDVRLAYVGAVQTQCLPPLRVKNGLEAATIITALDESPIFTPERRPLLEEGVNAYVAGDYSKAIHVIIPQIEQALRQLLVFTGVPTLKAARGGLFQLKNLNDILRESTVAQTFGNDIRLYLQTLLVDDEVRTSEITYVMGSRRRPNLSTAWRIRSSTPC